MKAKSLSLALLLLTAGLQTTLAQKVIVNLEDDQLIEYDVSQVKSIMFAEGERLDRVSNIIVQGTENPLFGTFNIPADIRPNLLLAYYSIITHGVVFPTTDDANYMWKDEVLTAKDWEMIGDVNVLTFRAPQLLVNGNEDCKAYAGKVYVTINPSSFDATGMELNLVNTQDEVPPITLSPLRRSTTILKNGRLRAAGNGFYEADAYFDILDPEADSFRIDIDESMIEQMPSGLQEFLNICADYIQNMYWIYGGLSSMASELYQSIRSCELFRVFKYAASNLDRNGLKFPNYNAMGVESPVYSQYNLTVTSFRPFSLGFCKDVNFEDLESFSTKDAWGPFMVASFDGRGFKFMSDTVFNPTIMRKDNLKLYLTTKTMELIVPVARKHIAVTNVFSDDISTSAQDGDAECLAKLHIANANDMFNTVLDGMVREVEVNNLEPGYIYELAYSILDFDGNISTRKFYIEVVV